MGFAGWIVVVLVIALLAAVVPAMMRGHERRRLTPIDERFAGGRTLTVTRSTPHVCGEATRHQPHLLKQSPQRIASAKDQILRQSRIYEVIGGDTIVQDEGDESMERNSTARSTAAHARSVSTTSREIAKLRASRAARVARENAAGQRRIAVAGVIATVAVAIVVAAVMSSLSWWWMALPGVALAALVAEGRVAYLRSVEATEREDSQMRRLRHDRDREQQRRSPVSASRAGSGTARVAVEVTSDEAVVGEGTLSVRDASEREDHAVVGSAVDTVGVAHSSSHDARRAASYQPVPAPTYAVAPVAARRQVSVGEEDAARETTAVSTPYRPTAANLMGREALTSEEAAQQAPVAFDLEEILELRRAQ